MLQTGSGGGKCCKARYFLPEDATDSDLLALLLDPFLTAAAHREADAIRAAEAREVWRDRPETLV